MKLLLANPAGLWALLAIPVVLLIHFLQERSRRLKVSTLFLLERVKPESVGGARFERLRNSVPLWMQILAALLLAWMLAEPRWIRQDSRQTVVVVLDSSISMSAFKEETATLLRRKLGSWSRSAAHTEWHLLESDARKPTLYAGTELSQLLRTLDAWTPLMGTHVPDDVLLTARGLVKENGIVIFVTDRKADVASDVALLSAGEDIDNVGFAGVEVSLANETAGSASGMKWRALVKNHGKEPALRSWHIEIPATNGAAAKTLPGSSGIQIGPGQSLALSGELPPDVERATMVLDADRFAHDDRLPLQKPLPRIAVAEIRVGGASGDALRKMIGASQHVTLQQETSGTINAKLNAVDMLVSELGTPAQGNAIQMVVQTEEDSSALDPAWTVAENHPLTRDLNWMGLQTPRPQELTLGESDEPLLWKGNRLLALLRHEKGKDGRPYRRLLLGWDLSQSNAGRHPAMLVMVHRFIEMVREGKRDSWADNFETGQEVGISSFQFRSGGVEQPVKLDLAMRADGDADAEFTGRVPERVGFFEVLENNKPVLRGAAHFADSREADFREAAPLDTVEERRWEAALRQTEADPWMPLWTLLALGCLMTAWQWRSHGRTAAAHSTNVRPSAASSSVH